MKKLSLTIIVALILGIFIGSTYAQADTPKKSWWNFFRIFKEAPKEKAGPVELKWYSYDQGMEMAKDKKENNANKFVYINFYGDWCYYCKKMESETFTDQDVASFLDENFLLIKVNGDKSADLTKEFVIRGYPTGLFMDSTQKMIGALPGFWPPDQFLNVLKFIKSESYKEMSYEEYASKNVKK